MRSLHFELELEPLDLGVIERDRPRSRTARQQFQQFEPQEVFCCPAGRPGIHIKTKHDFPVRGLGFPKARPL
jgi:hypothetical protein